MEHRFQKQVGKWEVSLAMEQDQIMTILDFSYPCHQMISQHAFSLFHVLGKERLVIIKVYIAPNAVSGALDKLSHLLLPFGGSDGKASACNMRDLGLIPGSGRSPGEGNDNPFWYPCLENSMDRGAW